MELNKSFSCKQPVISKVVFFILSLFVIISCDEDPLEVGKQILPQNDSLGVGIDTLEVELHTISMNPAFTRTVGRSPLGYYVDPVFGKMKAEFITDFVWESSPYFEDGLYEDSTWLENAEMFLYISSTYADTALEDFEVYELTEEIPSYNYSDYELTSNMFDPTPLNIEAPNPIIDTTGSIDEIIGYRFLISNDFAERLLDTGLINTDTIYKSRTAFRMNFPGFYFALKKNSIDKGIITIDHYSSTFVLRTNKVTNTNDTIEIQNYFRLGKPRVYEDEDLDLQGTSLNLYQYDYQVNIKSLLNDTENDQTFAYVQSLVGPKVQISIPDLFKKRREYSRRASVGKAELVLPIDTITFDYEEFKAPQYLGLHDAINDTNLIDDGLIPGYFGGVLDTVNMEYRFNIGNYIQDFLRDSINYPDERLFLFGGRYVSSTFAYFTDYSLTPGRVVLNSVNASRKPILRIIYSKLP